jgi:serine/threonine-protein kinase
MSNTAADRINAALTGRYQIERELGEGGMATVYLARDEKHNRSVALKVLKPELAAVVGAERFLAEIETTANLQHPHILPLFDSGEADGFLFYVMPYVEGETLRDRLEREKQLPVDEAVRIATAVAGALQVAHDKGIIHRDIKPANILLTGGQPLVADFGIALAVGAGGGARLTETGLSVGTPYYMSPEQATGDRAVGPASDIYALAAVLYEMLTGDPPYMGSTAQAVLGKIIQGEPVSATAVRRAVPTNIDGAIRKGLEKLPADRFTKAGAFTDALANPGFRHGEPEAATSAPSGRRWKLIAMGLALSTVVSSALSAWALTRLPEPQAPIRVSMELEPRVDLSSGSVEQVAIAPDGSFMVYAAGFTDSGGLPGLWLRRFDELEPVLIAGGQAGSDPVISPEGAEVAFINTLSGTLKVVPLTGGTSRTLATSAGCCTHWSGDGFVYFSSADRDLMRVPAAGGDVEMIHDDGPNAFSWATTRNGMALLFGVARPDLTSEVRAIRLETGEVTTLVEGMGQAYELTTGDLLMVDAQGTLFLAPFDADRLELLGPPVPVVNGLAFTAGGATFDLSDTGTLLYLAGLGEAPRYRPVWVDRSGRVEPVDPENPDWTVNPTSPANNRGWAISPEGSRMAIGIAADDGSSEMDIWIKRLGPPFTFSRLTTEPGEQSRPRWTPDGSSVTYISGAENELAYSLFQERADDLGERELLVAGRGATDSGVLEGVLAVNGWLALRLGTTALDNDIDVAAIRPGEDSVPTGLLTSDFNDRAVSISPDGRWMAHESDETGRTEVYVRSFPDATQFKELVSSGGGYMPVWSRSGRELFYVNGQREMVAVAVTPGDDLTLGASRVLFSLPEGILFAETELYALYDVDVDDQRFLMMMADGGDSASRLVAVFNWLEEALGQVGN